MDASVLRASAPCALQSSAGRISAQDVINVFRGFDDTGMGMIDRVDFRKLVTDLFSPKLSAEAICLLLDDLERHCGQVGSPSLPYAQVVARIFEDPCQVERQNEFQFTIATGPARPRKVTICGGGHAAHVMSVLIPSLLPDADVHVLTIRGDASQRWSNRLSEVGTMNLVQVHDDDRSSKFNARPTLVTNNVEQAIRGAEIIFLSLPAFAHETYLRAIGPHVEPGTCVLGMPAYPGFHWLVCEALGAERAGSVKIMGTDTLPWACRTTEYGCSATIQGTKKQMSICGGDSIDLANIQACIGDLPRLKCVPGSTIDIGGPNPVVHPAIMFGRWHAWDGVPLADKPAFYHGVDAFTAEVMGKMSDEVLAVRDKLEKLGGGQNLSDVIHIHEYAVNAYWAQMKDTSTLQSALCSNSAFDGLVHPMVETNEGTFVPDFCHRYFTEDVPIGMVPLRGIAQLAGVETPMIDRVLLWMQERMGKEFLKAGQLIGKDIGETRAPARFGITSVEQLVW